MKRLVPTGLAIFVMLLAAGSQTLALAPKLVSTWTYDPQTPNAPCPFMPGCGLWLQFRTSHPWPYQAFAVQENNGEAVVILSEPPPVFSREKLGQVLNALFGDDLIDLNYSRWPTGLDGWLEDIVLRVRVSSPKKTDVMMGSRFESWKAPADIVDRLRLLHRLLYSTSDGFWIDQITEVLHTDPIPELKIPVSDLAGWLLEDSVRWVSFSVQSASMTTRQLYAEKEPGVFYREPGIVAFVAPQGAKLAALAADFRRFAVESDLILGAAGLKNGGLLLLGRVRQIPLATLPPMRFESFASFARNRTEHLAQSYERQRIFAGKVRTGKYAGWDWAPILLSPQLDDSEFGTLLNLADQILKSWSQHGQVEYYGFAYPKPSTYPFGDLAASEYFAKKFLTASLIFNWNTEGLATITTVGGRNILTSDRTGALTILYRPSDSVSEEFGLERVSDRSMQKDADARAQDARDYFATLGDPILVRVVQNVLLYQAIQAFLVVSDSQAPPSLARSDLVAGVLEKRAAAWLSEIARGRTETDRDISATLNRFMTKSGFTSEKMAHVLASPQSVERDLQKAFQELRTSVSEVRLMPAYFEEAKKRQRGLFVSTCAQVGGHMFNDPVRGEGCRWPARFGETEEVAFATYHAYLDSLKIMASDYQTRSSRLLQQKQELIALEATYIKAAEIAKKLSGHSGSVNLDEVLENVLESTANTPVRGSIRTPSVVLSKNSLDVESIGGHNIDLIPRRRLVTPTIPSIGGPKPLPSVETEMAPPRPEIEALSVRRTGSLLEAMRGIAQDANLKSNLWPEMQLKAKGCQCDAVVVQGENGVVYFIRNSPPPIQQTIFGKSGVIDALAGPPAVKVVRFENFSDAAVENISRSTALVTAEPADSAFDRAMDRASRWLRSTENSGHDVSVTIERVGKEPEVLKISEESMPMTLKEPIPWRTASVGEATPAQWAELYGNAGRLNPATSDAVIVRFGGQPGISAGSLGVRILVEPLRRQGIGARLRAVVDRWRGAQPLKSRPWVDSLVDLREAIRQQLKPTDLEFYYKRNKGKVHAADAGSPERCTEDKCRG